MMEPVKKPLCFTAGEWWLWSFLNDESGDYRVTSACSDCTPRFRRDMRREGRCDTDVRHEIVKLPPTSTSTAALQRTPSGYTRRRSNAERRELREAVNR